MASLSIVCRVRPGGPRIPVGHAPWGARQPLLCLLLLLASVSGAVAQQRTAGIAGQLVDRETHAPVAGARVVLSGTPHVVPSDTAGRFHIANLRAGVFIVEVRAIGYQMGSWLLELSAGDVLHYEFLLQPRVHRLEELVIEERPGANWRSPEAFEQRRQQGTGYFITQEEIDRRHAASLTDLLRGVPGIQTACNYWGCSVRMARSTRACTPEYFLDGFPATFATGPDFPIHAIFGVEIYGSVTDVPIEFQRTNLRCGVIAIWTRPAQ